MQTCPSCGKGRLTGKFCPECGTKLPVLSQGAGAVRHLPAVHGASSSSASGHLVSRSAQQHTVTALHGPAPSTAKGQRIKREMDALADEVYGTANPTPVKTGMLKATQNRSTGESRYDRDVILDVRPLARGWATGPANTEGVLFDASERNILCMSVLGDECVVGSADHGLKVFDLHRGKEKKTLYTKKYGHTEWVTCCSYLRDKRIISGGMDSKLCLWASGGVRCDDLVGHTASISDVKVNQNNIAISASYDRTLKIWDCDRRSCVTTLSGHKQSVMEFIWYHSCCVSGDREGSLRAWDADKATCIGVLTGNAKIRGQCSALGWYSDPSRGLVLAGDQSGTLRVWDLRAGAATIHEATLHPGGALTAVKSTFSRQGDFDNMLVTAGADKRMLLVDPRGGFGVVTELEGHRDFIYSVDTIDRFVLSGAGNGWLLVHDSTTGECKYALGANKAAVRCLDAQPSRLTASGDDGTVITYDMT